MILPTSPRSDSPYRMCFAVEVDSSVVPLQQCVDCRFEKGHTVAASAWHREMSSLVGAGQLGPISSYLDDAIKGHRDSSSVDVRIETEGRVLPMDEHGDATDSRPHCECEPDR